MLALLALLQLPRGWSGPVLAERLGVTPRTLRRDIDRLRDLGYRISAAKGPDGGYRLVAGSELPPLLFDEDQAVAIAVALQSAPVSGVDVDEAAARALTTIRQVMPSRLRHRVDGIRFSRAQNDTPVDPAVLQAVSAAVLARHVLRFGYGDDDRPSRRTEPHEVVAREGRWYLLAWDLDAAEWRIFRLDRMTPRIPTGPVFTPRALPAADALTYLAARAKGSDAEDRWPCVGELMMELPARKVSPWLGPDDTVEPVDDLSCRVTLGSWSWIGVLATATRFDAPFTVVGPEPLRAAAHSLTERLIAASGPSPSSASEPTAARALSEKHAARR